MAAAESALADEADALDACEEVSDAAVAAAVLDALAGSPPTRDS